MTRRASTPGLLARLALLIYLLVSLVPAGGVVLCISGGTALALEASTETGTCSDCTDSAPCSDAGDETPGAGCDCIDVALDRPENDPRTVSLDVAAAARPPCIHAIPFLLFSKPDVVAARQAEPRPPGHLGALRSVVLLV